MILRPVAVWTLGKPWRGQCTPCGQRRRMNCSSAGAWSRDPRNGPTVEMTRRSDLPGALCVMARTIVAHADCGRVPQSSAFGTLLHDPPAFLSAVNCRCGFFRFAQFVFLLAGGRLILASVTGHVVRSAGSHTSGVACSAADKRPEPGRKRRIPVGTRSRGEDTVLQGR